MIHSQSWHRLSSSVFSRALEHNLKLRSVQDLTEDDSEFSESLHASLAPVRVELSDSPPPVLMKEWWA